jgi:NTE family protein
MRAMHNDAPESRRPATPPAPRRLAAALLILLCAVPSTPLMPSAEAAEAREAAPRPRIGLVLGGGGARGAAHIGVLEVLERLRVPVDCVAGTSMGALVAGAWAAGLTPAAMREEMARADWADMFQDNPDFTELNHRNKRLSQRFLPGSESGVTEDGVTAPPGVVSGQKVKLFFNQLVRADIGQRDMAKLALPVSIIATDIGTGERVVFRDGSLSQAMRASMSVPGLMAPYDIGGRKLVDGGLVDNVPIREVRERCGAEVVIAVNVGSPLLKPEEVSSLLSVSAQMVAILTEQNVSQSLATLKPGDVYLKPDLDGISAADFERHAEAADRGRAAAEGTAAALARLSVGAADYAAWRQRFEDNRPAAPVVDEIRIAGLTRVNPDAVERHVQQQTGEPLDADTLKRDLLRVYGDGYYESVDYALLSERDRQILRITPLEKPWGPDYLRLGLNLNTSASQGPGFTLRLGYQKTWLNALGAEMLLIGEIGSTNGVGIELYQPLDSRQQYFVEAIASYRSTRADIFLDDVRISEYQVDRSTIDLVAGTNIGLLGQARLGWRSRQSTADLETGIPALRNETVDVQGLLATLDLDQLNALYFPSRGWRVRSEFFASRDGDSSRLALEGRAAWPIGEWVLGARASYDGSTQGVLPGSEAATLGGFLNLSAFASGQLIGDDVRYAHLRAERIVGRLPLGLRGDMRLGLALEAGKVGRPYTEERFTGWLDSVTAYLGGETPFGPVYFGLSRSSQGPSNAYLFLGTP